MDTVLYTIPVLGILFYILHIQQSPSPQHFVSNNGDVHFCDTKTFQSEIIANIPTSPLLILGNANDDVVSPKDISDCVHYFLKTLNDASDGCFHVIQIHSVKKRDDPFNNVIDMTMHLYTQAKNHSIILNVILYINRKNAMLLHSVKLVNPVYVEDRWTPDNQSVAFEPIEFKTDFEYYDEKVSGYPLTS